MIKKVLLIGLLSLGNFLYANINAVVSILPQQTFLKAIGKDKVNITLMVKPGNSPHTYEPKPTQMKAISKADIYFAIDVEFEKVWLKKFSDINKKMKIVDISENIARMAMEKHSHHDDHDGHDEKKHDDHDGHDDHDDHDGHDEKKHDDHDGHDDHDEHESTDPHVWVSPKNVKQIATNIYKALIKIDAKNSNYYKQNYEEFMAKINKTDSDIKNILSKTPKHSKFMVFHPAWGYFARDYDLEQLAIEVEGKNPKPKTITHLIEEAKEENVKAIFTAPEFSDNIANMIANELNIKVIKVSPLNPKWSKNLKRLAKAIANK